MKNIIVNFFISSTILIYVIFIGYAFFKLFQISIIGAFLVAFVIAGLTTIALMD